MSANVTELVSWGPYSSLERERKICSRLFSSSIKGKIRHFHVRRSRAVTANKCTKKDEARAKLCFCSINLLFF